MLNRYLIIGIYLTVWLCCMNSLVCANSEIIDQNNTNLNCTHGIYNSTSKLCICDFDFVTYPDDNSIKCDYKMYSRKITLLLSIFLGIFGAGAWYIGRFIIAGTQLGVTILMFVAERLIYENELMKVSRNSCNPSKEHKDKAKKNVEIETNFCRIVIFVYWIVICVIVGTGRFKDGNGIDTVDDL